MANYSRCVVLAILFYSTIFNIVDTGIATDSRIKRTIAENGNPVLSIRPVLEGDGSSDALIWYHVTNVTSYTTWTRSLETFLDVYRTPGLVPGRGQMIYNCDYENSPPPGKVCDVDMRMFYPCISENRFNYHRGSPCVYLKLDTPRGWIPEFYNNTNSLPAEMPSDLKAYIMNVASTNPRQLNTVWVSCDGDFPADKEFIGSVQYVPRRGFPGYYFPNNDVEGYLNPLIALYFERPIMGILINIKCKIWARNIDHNSDSALGGGQFALLIDN